MRIRIPKVFIYSIIVAVLVLGGVFWFASNSTVNQPSRTNETTSPQNQSVREIEVTAKQFEFSPNPIRVKLGETIRLKITSVDVTHGFSLPEFGINETLNPNETVSVELQATKKGEFPFACSVVCGSGHTGMKGRLIVE